MAFVISSCIPLSLKSYIERFFFSDLLFDFSLKDLLVDVVSGVHRAPLVSFNETLLVLSGDFVEHDSQFLFALFAFVKTFKSL